MLEPNPSLPHALPGLPERPAPALYGAHFNPWTRDARETSFETLPSYVEPTYDESARPSTPTGPGPAAPPAYNSQTSLPLPTYNESQRRFYKLSTRIQGLRTPRAPTPAPHPLSAPRAPLPRTRQRALKRKYTQGKTCTISSVIVMFMVVLLILVPYKLTHQKDTEEVEEEGTSVWEESDQDFTLRDFRAAKREQGIENIAVGSESGDVEEKVIEVKWSA